MTERSHPGWDRIRIHLIGPLQVLDKSGKVISPRSKKAQALLGILALSPPGPVPRHRLAGLLWERAEPDQARSLLRGAVHELQAALSGALPGLIEAAREHLSLRRDSIEIDVDEFVRNPSSFMAQSGLDLVDPPPLMEGLEAIGPVFSAWLSTARLNFRERLRTKAVDRGATELDQSRRHAASDEHVPNGPRRTEDSSGQVGSKDLPTIAQKAQRPHAGVRIGVVPLRCIGPFDFDVLPGLLAAEISDALAQFRWMSVLPSETLAAAVPQSGHAMATAAAFGLDYVVDGQLFRTGDRVQLRTSLISVDEQSIVATFRAAKVVSDVLTFQEDVAAQLAASVDSHVQALESRRAASRPDYADAHTLLMQAVAAACRLDQMSFAKALSLVERALRLAPEHVSARVGSAQLQMLAASQGWVQDPSAALRRAAEDAVIALSLDPFDGRALTISGHVQSLLHRQPNDAVDLHRRALEMSPRLPFALHFAAANDLIRGDLAQAKSSLERHRHLVPPSGQHLFVTSATILLHFLEGDYEAAASLSRAVLHLNPNFVAAYKPYLAALGHLGLYGEARAVRTRLIALDPSFTVKSFLVSTPFCRPRDVDRYAAGLRRAGLG